MTKTMIENFEWDSLLKPENLSSEDAKRHLNRISDYLSHLDNNASVTLSSNKKISEIQVDDTILEVEETEFERISNDELFNYFQSEKDDIDSTILFPKTEKINALFWFLHHLGEMDLKDTKITVSNSDDVAITFYQIIEAATFFGFLRRTVADDVFYFEQTERFEEFSKANLEIQYQQFLAGLGTNETISEILQIQLNEPLYDSISKRMVHNILVKDPNIQEESLTNDEVKKIVNSLRYWYLGIKQTILEN